MAAGGAFVNGIHGRVNGRLNGAAGETPLRLKGLANSLYFVR
jgi:hypothetical protein